MGNLALELWRFRGLEIDSLTRRNDKEKKGKFRTREMRMQNLALEPCMLAGLEPTVV